MEYPETERMDILCNEIENRMECEDSFNKPLPTSSHTSPDIHINASKNCHSFHKSKDSTFQNLFNRGGDSLCESDSSVFRKQNPWDEDTSYKSDNFLPFLTKPKKVKLVNHNFSKGVKSQVTPKEPINHDNSKELESQEISEGMTQHEMSQGEITHEIPNEIENTINPSAKHRRKQSKPKMYEKQVTAHRDPITSIFDIPPDREKDTPSHPQDTPDPEKFIQLRADFELYKKTFNSHVELPRTLSILQLARLKIEPTKPNKFSKTHLYPEYKSDKEAQNKEKSGQNTRKPGKPKSKTKYPKPDPTKPRSYEATKISLLSDQLYSLIDDEKENKKKLQEIQTFCLSKWPGSENLMNDLELSVGSSSDVLEECVKAARGLGRIEEHCILISQIMNELKSRKKNDK